MVWVKFLHIAALSIWLAALFCLPALLVSHRQVGGPHDFTRIRRASRFVYLLIASPAACIAVISGTALLFMSDARHPWMFLKLTVVGVLIFCHYRYGSLVSHLADTDAKFPAIKARVLAVLAALAALGALWFVLAKPDIPESVFPSWMTQPGFLDQFSSSPGSLMTTPI